MNRQAKLERDYQGGVTLVTQNVDDLHERAGSKKILHMHGEILRKKCTWCDAKSDCRQDLDKTDRCVSCAREGGLRPDIVWFGEIPYHLEEIDQVLGDAKIFIGIGTSVHVYPAAGFVERARGNGAWCIEINKDQTALSTRFDDQRLGPALVEVPNLVTELLRQPMALGNNVKLTDCSFPIKAHLSRDVCKFALELPARFPGRGFAWDFHDVGRARSGSRYLRVSGE